MTRRIVSISTNTLDEFHAGMQFDQAFVCNRWSKYPIFVLLTSVLLLLVSTQLAEAGGATATTPALKIGRSIEQMKGILAERSTVPEMSEFVGRSPSHCAKVSDSAEICVWPLGSQELGWKPLASILNTRDRLKLVCLFPIDGAPRIEESCSVHPARSNRRYYRNILFGNSRDGLRRRSRASAESRAMLKAEAQQILDSARTAFTLSAIVGDAPNHCQTRRATVVCTWKSNSGTYGHGTLAMSIDANFSKRVELSCNLPASGTPREPESCSVYIGG